jgi:ATP-dependent DNA ligase
MDKEFSPIYLQKALKYDEEKHKKLLNGRWIQEKLDGVGAQVIFNREKIEIHAMTTAAKSGEFSNWTHKLPHLVEEFQYLQYYGVAGSENIFTGIIQGELIADHLEPGNPNFGFVTGTLHADDAVERQSEYKIKFVAYEMPTSILPYHTRYENLQHLFNMCSSEGYNFDYISLNPILGVNDKDCNALEYHFNEIVSHGREGVVLYDPHCMYKHSNKTCQRNKGLLKIKSENETEVLCVEMLEGKETDKGGKYQGTLGAMVCKDAEGRTFNIGSFNVNDAERQRIWDTMIPPFLVEMTYFEKTKDSYKLPRFKRIRKDKGIQDWNMVD